MVDIIAPVTDYISDSILTTRGDLLKRGLSTIGRFPVGFPRQILRVRTTGTDLEYYSLVYAIYSNLYSVSNTSIITISDTVVEVLLLDLGSVVSGDILYFNLSVMGLKGGVAGRTTLSLTKDTGTGLLECFHDLTYHDLRMFPLINEYERWNMSGFFRVVTSGTMRLKLVSVSSGSDTTVAIGDAQLCVYHMPT